MTAEGIDTLVRGLGSILNVLRDADPLDKAEIYRKVGLRLTYQPGENKMIAEARPPAIMYEGSCRRGDDHRYVAPLRRAAVHVKTVARFNVSYERRADLG